MEGATYGAEFELSDFDRREVAAWAFDERDVTMVNTNGVAVDPRGLTYPYGGEILARPSGSPSGVADQLLSMLALRPTVNYRSNLHVHVRVPGLREDLGALKRVQRYVATWMPRLLPVIEPIPEPERRNYPDAEAWRGARARHARRRVSHQKLLSPSRVAAQMAATTPDEFLDAEVRHAPTGRLFWATCPRACVNLRQLRETDTVEFRHYPGSVDPEEVLTAVQWADAFMRLALDGTVDPTRYYLEHFAVRRWPSFRMYDHRLECRYRRTSVKYVTRDEARRAIAEILEEDCRGEEEAVQGRPVG